MKCTIGSIVVAVVALAVGCSSKKSQAPVEAPAAEANATIDKPVYQMSERELDAYLRQVRDSVPDFRQRLVTIARANLSQPYEIYLLGEAPFETIDPQPVYCLTKSDCVVFAEHTIAMAMSESFPQFLSVLQRIRYNKGQIGVLTRNHYTEADWNKNNRWLAREITDEVGGSAVEHFTQKVDRAKFFKSRYKLEAQMPIETISESFIPAEKIDSVKAQLRDGDIVNFVSGAGENCWVGHVGLVALAADGSVNIIHSAAPRVREEPIDDYIRRMAARAATQPATKARFRGFKFLRIADDPWANLRAIDGTDAPHIRVPPDSPFTWPQYINSVLRSN